MADSSNEYAASATTGGLFADAAPAAVVSGDSSTVVHPSGYRFAQTPRVTLGVGGLPRAVMHFPMWNAAENNLRDPHFACKEWEPGPNIPEHWYDGETGWVSRYFTDKEPYSRHHKKNGIHTCQVPNSGGGHCGHEVANDGCCNDCCCWVPYSPYVEMSQHLLDAHQIGPPQKRQWATGLCDTEGCGDVICCVPCQGARQLNALTGHADTWSFGWCALLCFLGCRTAQDNEGRTIIYWIPPWIYAALLTRFDVIELQNIDEGGCCAGLNILFCPICSLAQTYRELSIAGVWPGGTMCSTEPPQCAIDFQKRQEGMN